DLLQPDGQRIRQVVDAQELPVQLPQTGMYTAVLYDNSLSHRGAYAIGLEIEHPLSKQVGVTALALGVATSASITGPAQQDLYTFSAQQGQAMTFALPTTGGVDPSFFAAADIYQPDGSLWLGDAVRFNNPSRLPAAPATGTYTVMVHDGRGLVFR